MAMSSLDDRCNAQVFEIRGDLFFYPQEYPQLDISPINMYLLKKSLHCTIGALFRKPKKKQVNVWCRTKMSIVSGLMLDHGRHLVLSERVFVDAEHVYVFYILNMLIAPRNH